MKELKKPSGKQTMSLHADEHLALFLQDLEKGSRDFELEVFLEGENASAEIRGIAKSNAQKEKKWKIKILLNGKNQNAKLDLRGVADDSSLIRFDGSGIVGENS